MHVLHVGCCKGKYFASLFQAFKRLMLPCVPGGDEGVRGTARGSRPVCIPVVNSGLACPPCCNPTPGSSLPIAEPYTPCDKCCGPTRVVLKHQRKTQMPIWQQQRDVSPCSGALTSLLALTLCLGARVPDCSLPVCMLGRGFCYLEPALLLCEQLSHTLL